MTLLPYFSEYGNKVGRLTRHTYYQYGSSSVQKNYDYDKNGNRRSIGTETFSYGANNKLNSYANTNPSVSISYNFDTIGRVTSLSGTTIAYDYLDNMTGYGSNTYTYDAQGQRLRKIENSDSTYYITSGPEILAEYSGRNKLKAEYVYALGQMICKYDPGQGHLWYYTDHLNSTRRLDGTDEGSGDLRRDYSPYGEELVAAGTAATNYQFSQKEFDSGIGLYYFGARYYSPKIGRWLVPDPAGQGWSPYEYCGGNPVMMVDRDGQFAFVPFLMYAYQIYSAAKTGYSMYQAYKAGGFGALFQAGVIGGISYGVGEITSGFSGKIIPGGLGGDLCVGAIRGSTSSAIGAYISGGNVGKSALSGAGMGALMMGLSFSSTKTQLQFAGGNDDKKLESEVASFINRHQNDIGKYRKNITKQIQSQANFNDYLSEVYDGAVITLPDYLNYLKTNGNIYSDPIIMQQWLIAAKKTQLYNASPEFAKIFERHGFTYLGKIYFNPSMGLEVSSLLAHELVHAVPYNLFNKPYRGQEYWSLSNIPINLPKY
jgi:RHS repeat-associated protein